MLYDIFISYSHRDNLAQREEDGWVDSFHLELNRYLTRHLGRYPRIWRDKTKMKGNYRITEAILKNIKESLIFLPILSPNFLNSQWCPRELQAFHEGIEDPEAMETPIFPVVVTPINKRPAEIDENFAKYEFFIRNENQEVIALIDPSLKDDKDNFKRLISSLAFEISEYIKKIEENQPGTPADINPTAAEIISKGPKIYLPEPSPDLWKQFENIKRDLKERRDLGQIDFDIVPENLDPLRKPSRAGDFQQKVREDMKNCSIAVHLIGDENSQFPRGSEVSYLHLQTDVAAERDGTADFKRLIWLPKRMIK